MFVRKLLAFLLVLMLLGQSSLTTVLEARNYSDSSSSSSDSDSDPQLKLKDTLYRPTAGLNAQISRDGTLAFASYFQIFSDSKDVHSPLAKFSARGFHTRIPMVMRGSTVEKGGQDPQFDAPLVEIFQITSDNKLKSIYTLPQDPPWTIDAAGISPNFDRFVVLEHDPSNTLRVRLFDYPSGALRSERFFNNVNLSLGLSINGGEFSPDGDTFLVRYVPTYSDSLFPITLLLVLSSDNLDTVASTTFHGVSNYGQIFNVRGKTYVAVAFAGGQYLENFIQAFLPPGILRVYQLNAKIAALDKIDDAQLPYFPNVLSVPSNRPRLSQSTLTNSELLAINLRLALFANEPFIGRKCFCDIPFTKKEADELRLYSFDGNKITLLARKNTNLNGAGVAFSPDKTHLAVIEENPSTFDEASSMILYKLVPNHGSQSLNYAFAVRDFFATPGLSGAIDWSVDGRHLIYNGVTNVSPEEFFAPIEPPASDVPHPHNRLQPVNLYKVKQND